DAEFRQIGDQRVLQPAQVGKQVATHPVEVEDRITDQLAGAVVGRVAAAVAPDELDLAATALGLIPEDMIHSAPPPESEDVRGLQQEEGVWCCPRFDALDQLALEVPGVEVGNTSPPAVSDDQRG